MSLDGTDATGHISRGARTAADVAEAPLLGLAFRTFPKSVVLLDRVWLSTNNGYDTYCVRAAFAQEQFILLNPHPGNRAQKSSNGGRHMRLRQSTWIA